MYEKLAGRGNSANCTLHFPAAETKVENMIHRVLGIKRGEAGPPGGVGNKGVCFL